MIDLPPVRGKLLRDEPLAPFTWFRVGGASSDRFAASIDLDGEVALDTSRFAWADTYDRLRGVSDHRDPAAAVDFSHAILPVLKDATATVGTSGILDGFPHRDALLKSFVEYLARRLQPAAFPAIGLALHFAKLTGRVSARSDKAAMEEFIAGLQSGPDRKALLQNFPLTDRMLASSHVSEAMIVWRMPGLIFAGSPTKPRSTCRSILQRQHRIRARHTPAPTTAAPTSRTTTCSAASCASSG
mgnify:CR=1 FL=1